MQQNCYVCIKFSERRFIIRKLGSLHLLSKLDLFRQQKPMHMLPANVEQSCTSAFRPESSFKSGKLLDFLTRTIHFRPIYIPSELKSWLGKT